MPEFAIDTNVMLAASTADPDSPFSNTKQVPPDELLRVLQWVMDFRSDKSKRLALDTEFVIWKEYCNHLREGDLGLMVLAEKLHYADFRAVTYENGAAILPQDLEDAVTDRSDRKFVAVALHSPNTTSIVNACDTDWYDCEAELAKHGVQVIQLADAWCRALHEEKRQVR